MTVSTQSRQQADPGLAEEIGAATSAFLRGEGYPARLRGGDGSAADIRALNRQVAELGLLGVLAPEGTGGIGGSTAELVAVFRAVGRGLLPLPLAESIAALSVLDAAAADRVEACVAGAALLTVTGAIGIGPSPWHEAHLDGGRISGQARLVNGADAADLLLVPARGGTGDPVLALVPTDAPVVRITRLTTTDRTYRPADVDFAAASAIPVAHGEHAEQAWRRLLTVARIAAVAELTGIADRLVELAVEYVKERKQFGRPIGSFQAVKHLAADAYTAAYTMDSLCQRLAGTSLTDPAAAHWADSAKAFCSRAAVQVAETTLQMLGGIGFTAEHDLAVYYPRILTLSDRWGDPLGLERSIGADALAAARSGRANDGRVRS